MLPSPLATNAGLRIARTPCVRGPQACTPAHGSACVHVPCADMHAGEHACTSLVLTCTSKNMRARALCWRARRGTCVHESCADIHATEHACMSLVLTHVEEHACTSLVLACTPENMRARGLCWRARRRTCVHEPCAGIHAGEHACTW